MREAGDLKVSFEALKKGELGLSPVYGSFLAEAASHCLLFNDHVNPVQLDITGDISMIGMLTWDEANVRRTWADLVEATEYGAYGVAIVVSLPLTETRQVERSVRGTGIDYWLGHNTDGRGIFQRLARLEVSGILKGTDTKIDERSARKARQTNASDSTGLTAFAVVVEFGGPKARFVKRSVGSK